MFLKFFGLREQPFGVTPDPRFLYLSPAHREALASVFYGIETGRGFLALIAMREWARLPCSFTCWRNFAVRRARFFVSDPVHVAGVHAFPAG